MYISLEQAILEAARCLPADKRQEILDPAAKLRGEVRRKPPFKSVRGLWADPGVSLPADEIDANQRDIWQNFPETT